MLNGKTLIEMDRRNVVFSVVRDRSKIQTFTPTIFKMSTQQQQQQQQTAEKSVQTQDSAGSATVLLTNSPVTHFHPENTAAEVANTLVSMATGHQRTNSVKQISVISVPKPTSLPILSLADYTTAQGVPTAMALASQAKISPVKHEEVIGDVDEDVSMSTDDYNTSSSQTRPKARRKTSGSKSNSQTSVEPIQYGPILVKPRKSVAPTLANGRRSKDEPLPPDEDHKRKQRRDRNKQAAAKCRRKRNELREELEKKEKRLLEDQKNLDENVQRLVEQKNQLEILLHRHACLKKSARLPTSTGTMHASKIDMKNIPASALLDSASNGNNKRVTINITNAQDLFAVAPLTRVGQTTTTDGSSNVPMITIHIIPEVAQALLGSTSVDKAKLAELLQQVNSAESSVNNSTNSAS